MNKNYKFLPSKSHHAITKYGLMAKPRCKRPTFKKVGGIKVARISKESLGVGTYQRKVDEDRVKRLNAIWHPELGGIHVAEIRYRNKFYYQIVDGQHRACASPANEVDCIVTNTQCPVDNFLMANDKKNVKPVSIDEMFWALNDRVNTVRDERSKKDLDDILYIINLFEGAGFNPQPNHLKKEKGADFGVHISAIHNIYQKQVVELVEKQKKRHRKIFESYSEDDFINFRRGVLKDVFDIMISTFGKKTFTAGRKYSPCWEACFLFLNKSLNWDYCTEDVIDVFSSPFWLKYGRGDICKAIPLNSINDWCALPYKYAKSISFSRDQWHQTFCDVYKTSKKMP